MSKRVFLVEAGEKGPGHTLDGKAVVIEADLDDEGRYAKVIAPQEFVNSWSSVLVEGSMGQWTECNGPARILSDHDYTTLCVQLVPAQEYKYSRNDPGWVVADSVEAATEDQTYVHVTYKGETYRNRRVTWHNPRLDKSKSDVLVEDEHSGWLYIEFLNADIKPYKSKK
ncbi:MAG: hypothetical protein WAV51_01885 [Microgenomates group bacterium]